MLVCSARCKLNISPSSLLFLAAVELFPFSPQDVIIKGKKRIQLSKDIDPQKLTKEDAEGYLGKKSKK